jgi:hypothetical protein
MVNDNNEVVMVRYGRQDGKPKNTLYTIRRGDVIYFGIARCDPRHDQFRKDAGKHIACERALLAVDEVGESEVSDFDPHRSGLRGACTREAVVKMLRYFDHIDEILIEHGANSDL